MPLVVGGPKARPRPTAWMPVVPVVPVCLYILVCPLSSIRVSRVRVTLT